MAYRAGATIVGPETPKRHMGPRYFGRYGQATWVGVLRDPQGKPIGPYVTTPDRRYGDMTMEARSTILEDYLKSGRGPVYMDCRGISPDDYAYMMEAFVHEGLTVMINHLRDEKIDLRQHPVEFGTYHIYPEAKIWINEKGETSIKGLYAAGDESIVSIGPAATYGWLVGQSAAAFARGADSSDRLSVAYVEEKCSMIRDMLTRDQGPDWKEANIALQQIMQDYVGSVRTETLMSAGLSYVRRVKERATSSMVARNRWELTRSLETLNLLDLAELVFLGARERKETRALHSRPDYPLTDPVLDGKAIFVRRVNEKPVMEWRRVE
jgi:succinate dehydrogenase/fumarate reductase flavoprotein subunit